MITISDINVARDLSYAKIYISPVGSDDEQLIKDTLKALNKAAGFIRHQLREAVDLRFIPQLRFVIDESINRGLYLSHLIDEAIAADEQVEKKRDDH